MLELQAACDALLASSAPTLQRAHPAQPKPAFAHTTLGSSTGQRMRSNAPPHRRIAWWLAGGALAIGAGVGLAVITASGGPHVVLPAQAAQSVTMPVQAPAPPPIPPPQPVATPSPAIDAGVATPAPAPKPHHAVVKPKPSSSDLYEDRGGG
jgi:hypothetical protein